MGYSVQYYDLVLGGIIASVAVGAVIGALTAIEMVVSVVLASGFAVALIGHALFVRGPVDQLEDLTNEVEGIGLIEIAD
jgi:hypothetical protein